MPPPELPVPIDQRHFEDYVPGTVVEYGPIAVDEAAIVAARQESLVWALERGSRSGRVAYQFAKDYSGRHHA